MATKKANTENVSPVETVEVVEEQIVHITPPVVEQELKNAEDTAKELSLKISKLRSLVNETDRVVALSSYGVEPAILTSQIKAILDA
jgi:hypothetical protein